MKLLQTDYIDLIQLNNPKFLQDPDGPNSTIAGLNYAQKHGLIRFNGLTNHSRDVSRSGISSGVFDTILFLLSMISEADDREIARACNKRDIGVIAMKAMSCGLIRIKKNSLVTYVVGVDIVCRVL